MSKVEVKNRAMLFSVLELLLQKELITEDDLRKVQSASDLMNILLERELVSSEELNEAVSTQRDFIEGMIDFLKHPRSNEEMLKTLRKRYGKKYPLIFEYLARITEHEDKRPQTTG